MTTDSLKVIVAQLGARQHYEIPRLCNDYGSLSRLHTDFWMPLPAVLRPVVTCSPSGAVRRLAGRSVPDLPGHLVSSHSLRAAYWRLRANLAKDRAGQYEIHCRWGEEFARRVAASLARESFTTFFGFSSASLEALEESRRLGSLAVLDEIAPTHLEDHIIAEEQARFPGWEPAGSPTPKPFLDRLQAEWAAADRIMVNSNWTRTALIEVGVPAEKIFVVPITFEAKPNLTVVKTRRRNEPLQVLWLGTLCLRKGLPYAIEAARRLEKMPVRFTFAGPANVNLSVIDWPENTTYVGQIPRAEVSSLWSTHHLFILPTLSDGFAITQIEAAAHGLPIIVTPNCGEVVEDGLSGLLVPPQDPDALANAVLRFVDGELELEDASIAAVKRAKSFGRDAVWPLLRAVFTKGVDRHGFDDSDKLAAMKGRES